MTMRCSMQGALRPPGRMPNGSRHGPAGVRTRTPWPEALRAAAGRLVAFWLCLSAGTIFGAPAAAPPPIVLKPFELRDQLGETHRTGFPRPRPLLLVAGDRQGGEAVEAWIPILKRHWDGRADIVGVAALRGIPRMFHQRIADSIRRSQSRPVLLDFDGSVTGQLPHTRRVANVYIIDPDGRLMAHVSGAPDPDAVGVLDAAFDGMARTPVAAPAEAPAPPAPTGDLHPPTSARASAASGVLR